MLRAVTPEDMDVHFAQQAEPEAIAMAAVPAREREAFDAHWQKALADPQNLVLTVEVDGAVAGSALSFVKDGRRMVGYWLGREWWGRGIASEALGRLLDRLSDERPLFATVVTHNPASRRVLEKHGFTVVEERAEPDVSVWVLRLG
jgi:RimJ/RimL family protein N-acetyltransferase